MWFATKLTVPFKVEDTPPSIKTRIIIKRQQTIKFHESRKTKRKKIQKTVENRWQRVYGEQLK